MWAPLVKKSGDPEIAEMASLEEKAHSTILLCLADDIITEVAEEETAAGLWLKLESLYMTKSLTNKLLLKRRLFSLRMKRGSGQKQWVLLIIPLICSPSRFRTASSNIIWTC
ncbi:hypothetical protein ACLB2K_076554 [Fragaria x ananassa]